MGSLPQDLRYALRQLRRTPGFTLTSVLTLAIGIGATTALFSLADAVLLRPLQFAHQDRLVEVFEDASWMGFPRNTPAPGNFSEWKQRNHVFEDMAALSSDGVNLTGAGSPDHVPATYVTANLFPLLGVTPIHGRNFLATEDEAEGTKVIIISAGLWQRRFGGDPNVIGRDVKLDLEAYRIVGVMPRGFTFPERSQIWAPLGLSSADLQNHGSHFLHVYARLRPGVSVKTAQADMSAIAHELAVEYPETNTNLGVGLISLRDDFLGDLHLALTLLLAGVGCVLLIACANVAGLMIARATVRQKEIAIRVTLGASGARLFQQAIAESILMALAGAALGLLLTVVALPFLNRLVPLAMAAWTKPVIDWSVATFATLISIISALTFGLLGFAPVRVEITSSLQQGGRSIRGTRNNARRVLVMAEIALALPLLVASGLIIQTVRKLSHVELGFTPDHVLTARTVLSATKGSPYEHFVVRTSFYRQVLQRVGRIPGVGSAGYTSFLPLTNRGGTNGFAIEGRPPLKAGEFNDANFRLVSPKYFLTMGMYLRAGRLFTEADNNEAPRVAVINHAMARTYWRDEDPVGRRFRLSEQAGSPRAGWITIVGVVDDVRQMGLNLNGRAEMYFPYNQDVTDSEFFYPKDLAVRVEGAPDNYADAIRKAVWSVDSQQPVSDVQPMQQLVSDELVSRNTQLKLFVAFALVSLLLAAIGLYGLIAYTVTQRTQEIGVRMALGARRDHILWLYLGEGARVILIGLAVGFAGSVAVIRALRGLVYGVTDTNPVPLFVSVAVLTTVGALAAYLPARRAALIEPMEALRTE